MNPQPEDEWPIRDLAAAAGVTSRTLRHYEEIDLLAPARVADSGYRFYGRTEIVRLYRILSLRSLGMPLPAIRAVLDEEATLAEAVRTHLELLEEQHAHLSTRIAVLTEALQTIETGDTMTPDVLFRNVDPADHEPEVRRRWGDEAWERSQRRRDAMTPAEQEADRQRSDDVNAALREAATLGLDPAGDEFQRLVREHYAWVAEQWGGKAPTKDAYLGLSKLYVADERFAAQYGGAQNAETIRLAIGRWATRML